MALEQDYARLAERLTELLGLAVPPLAISFRQDETAPVERYAADMPATAEDGRTGAVAAGCVFWMKDTKATFATEAADHGNCSVGSVTHGFKSLEEVGGNADVRALLDSGWVTAEAMAGVTAVSERPRRILYGPLAETPVDPDVIFLRLNGKQAMMIHEALPELRFEGKPQCHIVAIAKEARQPALSTGCMLSRVRTGMSNNELTCAVPGERLVDLVERLDSACGADLQVATYAAQDSKRFA